MDTETESRTSVSRGEAADPHHFGVGCGAPAGATFTSATAKRRSGHEAPE
jgi:hypothetical protein